MEVNQAFGGDEYSLAAAFPDHDSSGLKQSWSLIKACVKEFSYNSGQLMRYQEF